MRVLFLGGTRFVGAHAARAVVRAGHTVAVAHSGRHEGSLPATVLHLHGPRQHLVRQSGEVDDFVPDVIVDTFSAGGDERTTADKAANLLACAERNRSRRVVAISSCDVYQAAKDAGVDGYPANQMSNARFPVTEDSSLRDPHPEGTRGGHDNILMERALAGSPVVTILRLGMVYGPAPESWREGFLVQKVKDHDHDLEIPAGAAQLCPRVAVGRVAGAILAALEAPTDGWWACNVVDPYSWTYVGLAQEIASVLGWHWNLREVARSDSLHPFNLWAPLLLSDERLRLTLAVSEPDPAEALAETVIWLRDNHFELPERLRRSAT